ncbi:hypothetical protein ZOSMA_63G00420 [Zostera marina]|uniref:Uncharacterized protein n=1 Tax=Zostera marina TaxID=29655 RepID=A0A0K9NVB6_ZOSMR|nr:hypothetical protein ZOSMA_63G00420 [Zostera marina]
MAAKAKSATTAVKAALLSKSGQKVSSPSSSSQIEAAAKLNDSQWRKKYARYKDELSKGVWGYWELGLWKPLAISALHRAKLRREVLLAGEEWNHDPPRKPMRDVRKGHICDRIAAQKRENTAELMKKMPQMLLDYKKRRWEKKMKEEEGKD